MTDGTSETVTFMVSGEAFIAPRPGKTDAVYFTENGVEMRGTLTELRFECRPTGNRTIGRIVGEDRIIHECEQWRAEEPEPVVWRMSTDFHADKPLPD
jgi:hypothetical protein